MAMHVHRKVPPLQGSSPSLGELLIKAASETSRSQAAVDRGRLVDPAATDAHLPALAATHALLLQAQQSTTTGPFVMHNCLPLIYSV